MVLGIKFQITGPLDRVVSPRQMKNCIQIRRLGFERVFPSGNNRYP